MRRLLFQLAYIFALMATAFAIGAELGWQELPNEVKQELGGFGGP